MPSAYELYKYKPFFGSSHLWAQNILAKLEPSMKVIDIGAGSGCMGFFLSEKGFPELYAVEIDPETKKVLAQTYKSVVSDIDELSGLKFNVVLLLDILEHLADPAQYMQKLKKYLAPGALVLISVPNIAHWSVRFPLLFGSFNYKDRGILDGTHLHFFTRRSFKHFVKDTDLQLVELNQSIAPMEFVLPNWMCNNILYKCYGYYRKMTANLMPGLCAYQHLACLKYKD